MNKGRKRERLNFRISPAELEELVQIYEDANVEGSFSKFCRGILLGKIKHPYSTENNRHLLEVKDEGTLDGPYDTMIYYQSLVLASQYLMIQHDPNYKTVIKANKGAFEKILRQIRGYDFDNKSAQKIPLNSKR